MPKKYSNQELRIRAIHAIEHGMPIASVATAYQTHRATIYRWMNRYASAGESGLARKLGSGRPKLLEQLDSDQLTDIILTSAIDYGYENDLWTCGRIQDTIRTIFKVELSLCTIWRRLRDAELTYQKPERKYMEASEEDRKHWRRYVLPQIRKAVRKHKAILYFQDESNISLTAFLGKTWAPRGKTPTQEVSGKRGGVSAMSAISGIGRLIFKLHDKRIASDEVIHFLMQMLKFHPRRHLVVVMDQASPHISHKTTNYIKSQKRLHVFHLPKYSPDWNPDEKLWNHLKTKELKGHRAKTKEELKKIAKQKLNKLKKSPSVLRGIFFRCFVADLLQ